MINVVEIEQSETVTVSLVGTHCIPMENMNDYVFNIDFDMSDFDPGNRQLLSVFYNRKVATAGYESIGGRSAALELNGEEPLQGLNLEVNEMNNIDE